MKEIYIMLTQVGTLVSKSIKLYTKAKYNHSSIGVDPNLRVFYSFARRVRYFPLIGGFITEVVNEGMFKYYPETECAIYAKRVDNATYNKVCALLDIYKSDPKKYHYNLMALIGILLNKPFTSENRSTCAEFVAKILDESGIYTFQKPLCFVRPDDLPKIPDLNLIYEGRMLQLDTRRVG
ncbi:MAG: hypothetical protein ACOYIG_10495 [Acetivibrionales bacterium]|jgi:hypothetical protein